MKVLMATPWPDTTFAAITEEFPQVEFVDGRTPAAAVANIADAEVAFGHLKRDAFLAGKNLRWIQCQGAGVEWIAGIPELVAGDVTLTNTRGAHAATIAEHTFGMLVYLARGFRSLTEAQARKQWLRPLEVRPVGLSGGTLGVIGVGNIGRAIAKRGAAFDMDVIAVDLPGVPKPEYVRDLRGLDGLPDLLRESDAVVVALPYTEETRGMIGANEIALMKPTAYLVAISRGNIVDDRALARALHEGRIAGAGLDVQEQEPLPADHPLWDAPNLFLTPHCSGQSTQTTGTVVRIFHDNIRRYLAGEPLTNLVDKSRGY